MEVYNLIDKSNGGIKIANKDFLINSKLTQKEFLDSIMYNEVLSQDNNSYTNYNLHPQSIGNSKFMITLIFNPNGKIFMARLRMQIGENLPSWSNWSENGEHEMKEQHDNWLESNIGNPPYNYSWGTISSSYDPRSASSSITFAYKQ